MCINTLKLDQSMSLRGLHVLGHTLNSWHFLVRFRAAKLN